MTQRLADRIVFGNVSARGVTGITLGVNGGEVMA
jgi:hypothetical protein